MDEEEVISDMIHVAEDFYKFLQNKEEWVLVKNLNIQKFMDETADNNSGILLE